ncbi:MAG: CDP-alcohol phosphatidyltransferase family protein [Kofleriaceae bacterium]
MSNVPDAVVVVPARALDRLAVPVAGVPQLVRLLLTLGRGGVAAVTVAVVGDDRAVADLVAAAPAVARARLAVTVVSAADEAAALVAAAPTDRRFIVATPLVVFEPGLVKRLAASDGAGAAAWLATSADPGGRGGVAITTAGDRISQVGAGAGAAVGVAIAGRELVDAAGAAPGATLIELLGSLAQAGRLGAVEVGAALWQPVEDAAGRAAARTRLLGSLTKPTDGVVARLVNRRLSRVVTGVLLGTGVTPNQMTLFAAVFGVVGIALVAQASWLTLAIGAVLIQVQSILDGCDGELARLKFQGSVLGEWLDNGIDDAMNVAYPLALGHAATTLLGWSGWWWAGVIAAAGFATHSAVVYLDIARRHGSGNPFLFRWWFQQGDAYLQQALAAPDGGVNLLGAFHALGRRDLFLFAFMGCGLVGLPQVAVTWYAVIAVVNGGMAIAHALAGGLRVDRA